MDMHFRYPSSLVVTSFFQAIGNVCGGFIQSNLIGNDSLEWVRLLVSGNGLVPKSVMVNDGAQSFEFVVWEEELPKMELI